MSLRSYPRMLVRGFKPFNPVELARVTERIVCDGESRKYTAFYATGVYRGDSHGLRCWMLLQVFLLLE